MAVGGTIGYFQDGVAKKPWSDKSSRPSSEFYDNKEKKWFQISPLAYCNTSHKEFRKVYYEEIYNTEYGHYNEKIEYNIISINEDLPEEFGAIIPIIFLNLVKINVIYR